MNCYKFAELIFATLIYMYKHSRTKRSRTKHIKRSKRHRSKRTKRHRKTRQTGGDLSIAYRLSKKIIEHLEPIQITYGTTVLEPNEDLTGKALLYKQTPLIKFNPHKEKTYLVTLTDPDAPNGVGTNGVGTNGVGTNGVGTNGTWTHYVILMNNNNVMEECYSYQPPTPPPNSGVHRYIFNAYEYKHENLSNTKLLSGNLYYKQILAPIIKKKDVMATFQFTVST
jgi:hypothetical protein